MRRGDRSPVPIGIVLVVLLVVGSYFAYTKDNPFDDPYEVSATFDNAATLRGDAPVRIAGVNVGKVKSVEPAGDMAKVTFSISDEGQPLHADARIEIRPRLFLEGNFFLDVKPGTPGAPELEDGGEIPVTQTATAVQLDEVLSALESDNRADLQRLLRGYGGGLTREPTVEEDRGHDRDVRGETAAKSLNDAFEHGGDAGRDTAIVNDALIGERAGDLSGLIRAQRDVFERLGGVEQELQDLISNFNTTAGALAAESENLSRSVAELAPTLEEAQPSLRALSDSLPPLRALAIKLQPSLRELPATIEVASPWLDQMQLLLRDGELGGTARQLAAATPGLARTASNSIGLFGEVELLSRCATDVLEPTGNVVVNDAGPGFDFNTGQPNFREFLYGLVQQAAETQNFDGNGRYLRFQSGGGDELVQTDNPGGVIQQTRNYGNTIEAPIGVRPVVDGSPPPFRMDQPCFSSGVPNINGPAAAVGAPSPRPAP